MLRFIVLLLFIACGLAAAQEGKAKNDRLKTDKAAGATTTLTGCLDQRGSDYILAGAGMKAEARLKGKAFSDDNFARYIGHKVTVHGSTGNISGVEVFNVVKIEDVSQTCR